MVKLRDIVLQPGAKTPDNMMKNDMICHMAEGELSVVQNEKKFTVKKGDVWTCAKGNTTEGTQNTSNAVAIMRIIDLMATRGRRAATALSKLPARSDDPHRGRACASGSRHWRTGSPETSITESESFSSADVVSPQRAARTEFDVSVCCIFESLPPLTLRGRLARAGGFHISHRVSPHSVGLT